MENTTRLDVKANLNKEEKLHVQIMTEVARSFFDTPLVLKGGTALLLAYGLDRFSEDLDFDSNKQMNLESKIRKAVSKYAKVEAIDVKKQTNTAMRYRTTYSVSGKQDTLKIEISFRTPPKPDDINIVGGIKVYKLPALIDQKLNTLEERTKARDLYDVAFLADKYLDQFGSVQLAKLQNITQNIDALEKRFIPAFQRDLILANVDVQGLVLSLITAGDSTTIGKDNTLKVYHKITENIQDNAIIPNEATKNVLLDYVLALQTFENSVGQGNIDVEIQAMRNYQQKALDIVNNKELWSNIDAIDDCSTNFAKIGGLQTLTDKLQDDQVTAEEIGMLKSHINRSARTVLYKTQTNGKSRGR